MMQARVPSAENPVRVTVSIVSHGHGYLVSSLLDDLAKHCGPRIAVVLTLNIPEYLRFGDVAYPFQLTLIRNDAPKGFGANHNAAFESVDSPFFCVSNPDVRLKSDLFPTLLKVFDGDRVGVAGPLVRAPDGRLEDSARRFPTAYSLLRKFFLKSPGPDYSTADGKMEVDWVAGMFMLFDSGAFRDVGGFDEDYFLYYEDVDICRRLHAVQRTVVCVPEAEIIHEARRASRHNLRHAWWHAMSILRFLRSDPYGAQGRRHIR